MLFKKAINGNGYGMNKWLATIGRGSLQNYADFFDMRTRVVKKPGPYGFLEAQDPNCTEFLFFNYKSFLNWVFPTLSKYFLNGFILTSVVCCFDFYL